MKLLFKQRMFSWLDSYDVFDESGDVLYTVEGQLSFGHCLKIYDRGGNELGTVRERVFSFLPRFELYSGEEYVGCVSKEFSLFTPRFTVDCNGWQVEGDVFEWDYRITDKSGRTVAAVSKEIFRLTDTYKLDVEDPLDSVCALMLVLAIDAEKCSRG